jgi:hypothetical protein
MSTLSRSTIEMVRMGGDFQKKGLCMFKSQQYRAKAAQYGELVKSSADAEETRKFQDLKDRFASLANNERDLADAYHDAVHIDEPERTRGRAGTAREAQSATDFQRE